MPSAPGKRRSTTTGKSAPLIPDRYHSSLARSLSNLGASSFALGRPADALPVTEEAIAVYRELAQADPGRYRPDITQALDDLAANLTELDRDSEAEQSRETIQ